MKTFLLVFLSFFVLILSCTKPFIGRPVKPKPETPTGPFLRTDTTVHSTLKPRWALDSIKVYSNVSWKAVLEPRFGRVELLDSVGHGNGYITFRVAYINPWDTTYSGSLEIVSDSATTVHMQIKQPTTPNPYFFCNGYLLQEYIEGYAGWQDSLLIFSNAKWAVSKKPSWVSIKPSDNEPRYGWQVVYITTSEMNKSDTSRYGDITIGLLDSSRVDTSWGPSSFTVRLRQRGYGWIRSLKPEIILQGDSLSTGFVDYESNTYCHTGIITVPGVISVDSFAKMGKGYFSLRVKTPNRTGKDLVGTITLESIFNRYNSKDDYRWAEPITIPVIVKPSKN